MNQKPSAEKPLFAKLLQASGAVQARMEVAVADLGLSLSKCAVLCQLTEAAKPLPLSVVAEKCSCVKSNITQLVDALEEDGLVKRVDDPDDRRSVLAVITDEGRRRHKIASQALASAEKELFESFNKEETGLLRKFLDRFDKE